MSPTTIEHSPSKLPCLLPRVHGNENTTTVNANDADPNRLVTTTSEAREYLKRLLASWMPAWHAEALCRGHDPGPWFPRKGESNQPALEVCGKCPVRAVCLTEALDDPKLDFGIRGGATANARKTMRRNRQRPYIPAAEGGP
jgi:WhiB family redox-sensing transcriptional regulator